MRLNTKTLENRSFWKEVDITLPNFNFEKVKENTINNPRWLHFGAGNIFRAFPAVLQQKLIENNDVDYGIIVAEGYDFEIIEKIYHPNDNHGLVVTLKSDGTTDKRIVSSVVESLTVNSEDQNDMNRLMKIFESASLQMVSFTITEKGYNVLDREGELLPYIADDVKNPIEEAKSYLGNLVRLLYIRYKAGAHPLALVSMDNVSHNGDKLFDAVNTIALEWLKQGSVDQGFVDYIQDEDKLSFPWSMIDKITPRPDGTIEKQLLDLGFEDAKPIITEKGTYISSFVNAEEAEYLVIEDKFPNGRPPLDKVGVIFTDKETVDKVEKMKVCTCLNPLHTALAIFGCLLDHSRIYDEMQDEDLVELIKVIGYEEGLPVVVDPGIIEPKAFIDEVINVRFSNPFMPDTPQRIATDTSQKLAIRFGETIKAYDQSNNLDVNDLELIPLVIAGWVRYLMGVSDHGERFELSPDPLLDSLHPYITELKMGEIEDLEKKLKPILSNKSIFGVDFYALGMDRKIVKYFESMIKGTGAVRSTLQNALNERRK